MAVAEIDIANLAIVKLGGERLTSLTEDNNRAVAFNALYTHTRDAVLEDHPWQFARTRVTLAQASPVPLFGYAQRYALPGDYLALVGTDDDTQPWMVEDHHVFSNRSSMMIVYIRVITDTARFSPTFIDALAERLAAEMAIAITGKTDLKQFHWEVYLQKISTAGTRDSQSQTPPLFSDLDADLNVERFA